MIPLAGRARWLAALSIVAAPAAPLAAQEPPGLGSPAAGGSSEAIREASNFAPTTTLHLQINAVLGALQYSGSVLDSAANTAAGAPLLNGVSVNHEARLTVDTSFTGQDLVRIRLRSGDFAPSGFFTNPPTPLTRLDFAFQDPACSPGDAACPAQLVSLDRAFLQLPLTPELRLSLGPRIMQLDMLPVWPSVYNASPILDLFQYAGSPGTYGKRLGGGFGAWWQPGGSLQGLSLAYAYVAPRAGESPQGGLLSADSSQTSTIQLAFSRPQWSIAGAWSLSGPSVRLRGTPLASQLAADGRGGSLASWSLAGYWQPRHSGWIPSVSAGWGFDSFRFGSLGLPGLSGARTRSWYAGLVWSDVLGVGNSLGAALGSPSHVAALTGPDIQPVDDRGLAAELFYRIVISDNLSLTPASFWLSRPRGALTGPAPGASLRVWGSLIRATLRY